MIRPIDLPAALTTARAVLGAAVLLASYVAATPQTVGDEACPKYAVDIESFATCEGDRVVRPANDEVPIPPRALVDDEGNPLPSSPQAIPRDALSQTHHGHYLTAMEAHAAKQWLGRSVLFIDVRHEASVAVNGVPQTVDFNLPVARPAAQGRMQIAYGFAGKIKRTLAARGLTHDALVFVICEDGRNAALAAELLAQAGVPNVFAVRGGIYGEKNDRDAATGWIAAQLPMRAAVRTGA